MTELEQRREAIRRRVVEVIEEAGQATEREVFLFERVLRLEREVERLHIELSRAVSRLEVVQTYP